LTAQIPEPGADLTQMEFGAVICGPDFASGLDDVRRILASSTSRAETGATVAG
jgi:hypothetical protein